MNSPKFQREKMVFFFAFVIFEIIRDCMTLNNDNDNNNKNSFQLIVMVTKNQKDPIS